MADTYFAYLDNTRLEMETIDDTFEKSIVRHEFPFRDGALLEDMGQKARTVRLRCYFWDDGGDHATYDDHILLINHLASRELFELDHPMYGIMKGCVESVSVRHDDRQRTAEVDITFVENLRGEIEPAEQADVEAEAEAAFTDVQERMMDSFSEGLRDVLGPEAAGILDKTLDASKGVLEQFQNVSLAARNYLKKVDTFVSTVESTLTEIANPANSLVSTINFGTNLPGRVIGSVTRCVERYARLYETLTTAPARFADSFNLAALELERALGFGKSHVRSTAAAQAGYTMATLYKADEEQRQSLRRKEKNACFDASGTYTTPETAAPVMNVRELEQSLATTRTMIQRAVDQDRRQEGLKTMARRLLEHVNSVKLEREKIVAVDLDNVMPLHLVCLKYGLPYNTAERIHSINRIPNPSFASGRVSIYGR
jgi:prophage DNA circulation protein